MESGSQARARWRLLERLGQACGFVAGIAAVGLLWLYALTLEARRRFRGSRAE